MLKPVVCSGLGGCWGEAGETGCRPMSLRSPLQEQAPLGSSESWGPLPWDLLPGGEFDVSVSACEAEGMSVCVICARVCV